LFRERATRKQASLTYASRDEAERMAAVIEANGGDLRSAEPGHVVVSTRMIFGFGVWYEELGFAASEVKSPPRVSPVGGAAPERSSGDCVAHRSL